MLPQIYSINIIQILSEETYVCISEYSILDKGEQPDFQGTYNAISDLAW